MKYYGESKAIFLLFGVILLSCCFIGIACGTPAGIGSDVLVHYSFDRGTGTTAYDSTGFNNGTFHGNATRTISSDSDNCLQLDGNGDWVDCPGDTSATKPTYLTLSAWIRPYSIDSHDNVISRAYNLNSQAYYSYGLKLSSNGRVTFVINLNNVEKVVTSPLNRTISTYEWHHIAGTFDGSQICVYIDGELTNTLSNLSGSISYNDDRELSIGRFERGVCYYYGEIDNATLVNRALNANEMECHYYQSQARFWYSFETTSGSTVYDDSGNCFDATLYGNASIDANDGVRSTTSSLDLDGSGDYLTCSGSSSLLKRETFMISLWIKPDRADPHDNIISKAFQTSGSRYYSYGLKINPNGNLTFVLDVNQNQEVVWTGNNNSIFGNWTHITFGAYTSPTSTTMGIYVNGVLNVTKCVDDTDIAFNDNSIFVGKYEGSTQCDFDGHIDEAAFFPHFLTSSEIGDLYSKYA